MSGYATRRAVEEWDREIDEETARLIEDGVPPFNAAERARDNVSRRRAQKRRFHDSFDNPGEQNE